MRRLELDFVKTRAQGARTGWVLLALAAWFASDLGSSYVTLTETVARKEARVAESATLAAEASSLHRVSVQPPKEGELADAKDTIRQLSIPWDSLFRALEGAQTERVSLLAIEPEAESGTVTLTAEAKDYLAALSYVANLEAQKGLARVHMTRHELRQNNPQRPVAFAVSASWKERR